MAAHGPTAPTNVSGINDAELQYEFIMKYATLCMTNSCDFMNVFY